MYKLAQDLVDRAEQHGNRWISQVIPGMYNEKVIDPTSVDMNNLPNGVEVREYKDTVNSIKKWMKYFQENRIDIKIS